MKFLKEVRREDDTYYQGPFWIVGDSEVEINKGNFQILGDRFMVDFNGNYTDNTPSTRGFASHRKLWGKYRNTYDNVEYDYYPRGRVRIVNGTPFIHINSKMNIPRVINSIIKYYNLEKLSHNISIEEDDLIQGSHYGFKLK